MSTGEAARRYHRLTSYQPEREWTDPVDDPLVRQDFQPNDLDRPRRLKNAAANITTLRSRERR
jgi:hypothetical protein